MENKKESFSILFWFLAIEIFGLLADTELWSRERTGMMLDDKPVLSNSLIALGSIWW